MTDWLRAGWGRLIRNPGTKLLSLLLAFVAWFWVQSQQQATVRVRVPVRYAFADGLVNVDPLPASVSVSLQGTRAATRRTEDADMEMVVDLSTEMVGSGEYMLDTYPISGVPSGLVVDGTMPDRVRVRIDERSTRNVEVIEDWLGEPEAGFSLADVSVTPEVAEITGPRAVVESLARLRIKPVDVSGFSQSAELPVELDLPRGVTTVADWEGIVSVEVVSQNTQLTVRDVPVVVLDPNYQLAAEDSTRTLLLAGPTQILRGLRTDKVMLTVTLPEDASAPRYIASFEASRPPRIDVLLPRPDVVRMETPPAPIQVTRR